MSGEEFRQQLVLKIVEQDLLKVKEDILSRGAYAKGIVWLADEIIVEMGYRKMSNIMEVENDNDQGTKRGI